VGGVAPLTICDQRLLLRNQKGEASKRRRMDWY